MYIQQGVLFKKNHWIEMGINTNSKINYMFDSNNLACKLDVLARGILPSQILLEWL